jgi:SAM-dependent methyltransferase
MMSAPASTIGVQPFEWLTSSESLIPVLQSLSLPSHRTALHVGSGSSTLGEVLIQELGFDLVVNMDKDDETLQRMKERWRSRSDNADSMRFLCSDWIQPDATRQLQDTKFDLVLDKSTLDCALCSEHSTAALLTLVYDHLKPGGYYVVISFHQIQFLKPLLQDCPGTHWDVSTQVITCQVEDLIRGTTNKQPVDTTRTANVLICHKQLESEGEKLDYATVETHVQTTNNYWFQQLNPLLSHARRAQLERDFEGIEMKTLSECYQILFTDQERELLTYEFFLEDWDEYCKMHPSVTSVHHMTLAVALDFLNEMQ